MKDSPLVLVVDDEVPVRRFLVTGLVAHGYRTAEAGTLLEAMRALAVQPPDVVLLDLGLPDGDGVDLVKRVREWSAVPILVLSARGRESDKISVLDAGADDYLTKPFAMGELLARVRVALRRADQFGDPSIAEFTWGDLTVGLDTRRVTLRGVDVHLTPTEWKLLAMLVRHRGRVLSHRQILREVWGPQQVEHVHYVRVHMAELRKKLEAEPARPRRILTETGVGYRFRDDV